MKYNKGFAPLVVLLIMLGVLAIGGAAYYLEKSSVPTNEVVENSNYFQTTEENYTPPTTNNNTSTQQQVTPPINNQQQTEFISPTQGSTWSLGSSMPIEIKTKPQQSHCSNGFYLVDPLYVYDPNGEQLVSSIGIITNPDQTSYVWPDTSKRFATCGSGVGEIPITVSSGTYKICFKEDTFNDTGYTGHNFYCSGLFTIQTQGNPVLTQSQANLLVHQTWGDCSQGDCGGVTVTVTKNSGGQYVVTAIFTELDDSTSQTKRVSVSTYQNGTWALGQPTITRMCHRGNSDGTIGWTVGLCI